MRGAGAAAPAPLTALRDIGDRVVGDGNDRVSRPVVGLRGRAALGGLGRPAFEVIENAPHHSLIVDQRDHAHRPAVITSALRAYERIGFVHFADEPCPRRLGARGELAHRRIGCRGRYRGLLRLERLRAFTARAVGVPAYIAHQMFVPIGGLAQGSLMRRLPGGGEILDCRTRPLPRKAPNLRYLTITSSGDRQRLFSSPRNDT